MTLGILCQSPLTKSIVRIDKRARWVSSQEVHGYYNAKHLQNNLLIKGYKISRSYRFVRARTVVPPGVELIRCLKPL